jgi:hypothetical protein
LLLRTKTFAAVAETSRQLLISHLDERRQTSAAVNGLCGTIVRSSPSEPVVGSTGEQSSVDERAPQPR